MLLQTTRYCAKYDKSPIKDAYDLETLKHFMNGIVFGLKGCKGEDDLPSFKSVKQVWKDFTAQFQRENNPIPPNTTLSVTNIRGIRYIPSHPFSVWAILTEAQFVREQALS